MATEAVSKEFDDLITAHARDPYVASGVVRDEVYLHSKPGRDTDKLYRLDEGEKLKLIARASTLKPVPPGYVAPVAVPVMKKGAKGVAAAPAPRLPCPRRRSRRRWRTGGWCATATAMPAGC